MTGIPNVGDSIEIKSSALNDWRSRRAGDDEEKRPLASGKQYLVTGIRSSDKYLSYLIIGENGKETSVASHEILRVYPKT